MEELSRPGKEAKCTKCKKHPCAAGRKLCAACLRIAAKYRAQHAVAGLCNRACSRPRLNGYKCCAECLNKKRVENRAMYHDRLQRGQCPKCHQAAAAGSYCFDHWVQNIGNAHGLGNKNGIKLLRDIWEEQKGVCAVTGTALVPGGNASIDHNIPKSRGGTNDRSNLRWVLLRVNQLKWDMTHEELLDMCRLIVATASKTSSADVKSPEARSN